jgi:hypothetical protein
LQSHSSLFTLHVLFDEGVEFSIRFVYGIYTVYTYGIYTDIRRI